MCGIAGFIGHAREGQWRQTHSILGELFLASEHRGRDATGFAALTDPLGRHTRQLVVVGKEPVEASRFVGINTDWKRLTQRRCAAVIQHVRAATHGNAHTGDNRNNHPFVGDNGLLLVHNGIISNHAELMDQFSLRARTECDSEALLRVVEQAKHPAEGLTTCLREVQGSMAVAVLDSRRGVVYLATNGGRPLWVCRLRDERRMFFASTVAILLTALEKVLGKDRHWLGSIHPLATGFVHAVTPDGRFVSLTAQPTRYLDFDG